MYIYTCLLFVFFFFFFSLSAFYFYTWTPLHGIHGVLSLMERVGCAKVRGPKLLALPGGIWNNMQGYDFGYLPCGTRLSRDMKKIGY
ncbi:hypothetical protein J3F84DRAFT_315556 [Trichoderma pleuroticola]